MECDVVVETLDDSAELVAQLKQLVLDGLQAFELGEELEGGFASEASGITRGEHRHRPPKPSDLAGPGRSLHGGEASERMFLGGSATSRQVGVSTRRRVDPVLSTPALAAPATPTPMDPTHVGVFTVHKEPEVQVD